MFILGSFLIPFFNHFDVYKSFIQLLSRFHKLISLGNLLVKKVMWLVLTTTCATLILSRAFGANCMRRIAYIYSRLPRTHSLTFFINSESTLSFVLSAVTYGDNTHTHTHTLSLSLSLSLSIATYRDNTLTLTF